VGSIVLSYGTVHHGPWALIVRTRLRTYPSHGPQHLLAARFPFAIRSTSLSGLGVCVIFFFFYCPRGSSFFFATHIPGISRHFEIPSTHSLTPTSALDEIPSCLLPHTSRLYDIANSKAEAAVCIHSFLHDQRTNRSIHCPASTTRQTCTITPYYISPNIISLDNRLLAASLQAHGSNFVPTK
jgi:hypothetical protein